MIAIKEIHKRRKKREKIIYQQKFKIIFSYMYENSESEYVKKKKEREREREREHPLEKKIT